MIRISATPTRVDVHDAARVPDVSSHGLSWGTRVRVAAQALAVAVPANRAAPHGAPAHACVVGVDVHQGRHAEVVGHVHDVAAIDVTTVSRVRIPGESVLVVYALDDLAATVGR